MGHVDKKTLSRQMYEVMQDKEGFGRSKQHDKALGITNDYIYSYSTMKAYIKHCNYFLDWVKKNDSTIRQKLGHKPRTLSEIKEYAADWINERQDAGLSAYTLKLEVAALNKMYGECLDVKTKATKRSDIKRSRGKAIRDANFSESKNADLINFCRCVGCRRSELVKMKASDLRVVDGKFFIKIVGKGGRERLAPIVGDKKEVKQAMAYLSHLNGSNQVHNAADVHSYRADYATKIYKQYAATDLNSLKDRKIDYTALTGKRDKDGSRIYKSALYICRNDRKGERLDRQAMIKASKALGHNRESVIGEHYLRI